MLKRYSGMGWRPSRMVALPQPGPLGVGRAAKPNTPPLPTPTSTRTPAGTTHRPRVKNNSLLDQARRSVVTQFLKRNLDSPKYSHHRDQALPSVFTRWPTVPQPTLLSSDTCHSPLSPDTATLKSSLPQQPSLSCFHLLATERAVSRPR